MTKTDWHKIDNIAHKALKSFNITTFPVNIYKLLTKQEDVVLCPYSQLKSEGMSEDKIVQKITHSVEGSTLYRNGIFYIFFNDDTLRKTPQRIRYTLAHELGHILLGHFEGNDTVLARNTSNNGLPISKYKTLETEAESFAAEFLAPVELVFPRWNYKTISSVFDISNKAAKILHQTVSTNNWHYNKNSFFNLADFTYTPFISHFSNLPILPKGFFVHRSLQYGYCDRCYSLTTMYPFFPFKFCPTCGKEFTKIIPKENFFFFHELEESNVINYNSIDLDKFGRAPECPICHNLNKSEQPFCEICGTYLINRCSGFSNFDLNNASFNNDEPEGNDFINNERVTSCADGKVLSGRARYCPFCGCLSTFELQKIFPDYKVEMKQIQEEKKVKPFPNNKEEEDPFNSLDISPSDLPF